MFGKADHVEDVIESVYDEIIEDLKCKREGVDNISVLMKAKKDLLVRWIQCFTGEVVPKNRKVVKELRDELNEQKTQTIQAQSRVVELQNELLKVKSDQLESVKATVQTSVKEGMQLYSSALGANIPVQSSPPQKMIRKVVNEVIRAEDRGRSLIVFGLEEEQGEDLKEKVGELFLELGEKPRVEAVRLGPCDTEKSRPVQVTVNSSICTNQILRKRAALKDSDKHNRVFISPDRTLKEREERRKLVVELKKRRGDEPGRRHFIRGEKVCSESVDVVS